MGAGRTGWFAVWKNAEAKDLDLVLDWRDHGPQGLWGRRSTQQNLAFHARPPISPHFKRMEDERKWNGWTCSHEDGIYYLVTYQIPAHLLDGLDGI